jgi:hypothetical protein
VFCFVASAAHGQDFEVRIAPGLNPRMKATDAAQVALQRLAEPVAAVVRSPQTGEAQAVPPAPTITSVACLPGFLEIGRVDEPEKNLGPEILWRVQAEGLFVNHFVPPGAPPQTASEGFVLIDDATGEVVMFGSLPGPSSSSEP